MEPFVYSALPARIIFERGSRKFVAREVERLGRSRAMVLCTAGRRSQADELAYLLGDRCAGVLDTARMHTPVTVSDEALVALRYAEADCTVAVGGGSTIGLGKALSLRGDYPQIALPTTYSGSEMTAVVGQTANDVKTTLKDIRVLPATVIYDVDYTLNLPADVSAVSGLNAIAHAVEALYAQEKNPVTDLQCLDAIAALNQALPKIAQDPHDLAARNKALYGAFLCGMALGSAGMALHHKLCHTLGGSFDLPHAPTHAVILPHATSFNAPGTHGALEPLAGILQAEAPGAGLWDLARRIGAPVSLAAIGMPADALDQAAELATANPYWNPRKFTRDDVRALLKAAYAGERPTG